jgi:biotin carboxyl carrier protein
VSVEVRSPTTGVVLEVVAGVGQSLAEEDEILIIESMKMHIPVTAPAAGTLASLLVAKGDHVSEDDLLATIE